MPRRNPPDHTGPEAVAGLSKRLANRSQQSLIAAESITTDGFSFIPAVTITAEPIRAKRITCTPITAAAMRVDERQRNRLLRELRLLNSPGWIDADPPTFAFPGWGPRWRPFDFEVDT